MKTSWGKAAWACAGIGLLGACGHSSTSSAVSSQHVTSSMNSAISSTGNASTSKGSTSGGATDHPSGASSSAAHAAGSTSQASSSASHANTSSGNGSTNNAKIGQQSSSGAASISIPSIGLNHGITAGGLNGGVLSPSPGEVEQFVGYGRVAPGMSGISVIAGHVTYNGPDVFYRLGDVPVGGKVTITFADGKHEDFVVTDKESINKDSLTNDNRVWGSSSSPVLVIVTCDSNSGWANAHHHVNNLVLWARPA